MMLKHWRIRRLENEQGIAFGKDRSSCTVSHVGPFWDIYKLAAAEKIGSIQRIDSVGGATSYCILIYEKPVQADDPWAELSEAVQGTLQGKGWIARTRSLAEAKLVTLAYLRGGKEALETEARHLPLGRVFLTEGNNERLPR